MTSGPEEITLLICEELPPILGNPWIIIRFTKTETIRHCVAEIRSDIPISDIEPDIIATRTDLRAWLGTFREGVWSEDEVTDIMDIVMNRVCWLLMQTERK